MEFLTSPMENQMEAEIKKMVKKEEVNDRYSIVANAEDQKKPSEKAKRSIGSMFRRSVKVENTECEQPTKHATQITARPLAAIEPVPIKVRNTGSTARHESSRTTTTLSADAGRNERSIWESDAKDHDDGCSDDDGDMNESGLLKRRQVKVNANDVNDNCDRGQFSCLDCAAVFETYAAFKVHIATHAGYQRYKCTVCKKRFTRSDVLNEHMRIHTGERPFECDVCKKKFTRSGHLIEHRRVHTGARPFKCTTCKKRFSQIGSLNKHKVIHTGKKPFKCNVCKKGFAENGNLTRHKRIHTGEKPYKCLTCGKCFTQSSSLRKHNRTHAGPDADSQLDAQQDRMDQPSTTDACDPVNNYANGQKIRYKTKSIDYVVEKMASRNPDILYLVWSKQFTMELASAVARSGYNCILCVKKIQPQPFRDVVKLSDALHTCQVEVGPDSTSLRLFSFGGMFLSEKITNHGTFKSLAKFETKMRRFSQSEGMEMVNIFKHSKKNSSWYRSLKDGLKGESIITDSV